MKSFIFVLFCLFLLILSSCSLIKPHAKYDFSTLESYRSINGVYENRNNRIRNAFSYDGFFQPSNWHDTTRYYKIEIENAKKLHVYGLTNEGFRYISEYKGKYNPEKNYFQITLGKKIIPAIIFAGIANIKLNVGKNWKDDLFLNGQEKRFAYFIGFGAINDESSGAEGVPLAKGILVPYKDDLGMFGYKDLGNNIVIRPRFDAVTLFDRTDGKMEYAKVKKGNKWGIINRKGEEVIPIIDDSVNVSKNHFFITNGGESYTVDVAGNRL